jgi:Zn-dependent protease with chaperone function
MYFLVGISLLFATLYAVNLAASLLTAVGWHYLSAPTANWNASTRSNLIFIFRVLPLTIAIIVTFGFILPAFVLYEPTTPEESIGLKMAVIVCLSAFGLVAAVYRIVASWWQTRRLIGDWMTTSEPVEIEGVSMRAYQLRHPFPVVAVVGIFRPRIFVAEQVFSELDKPELVAALSHEAGHISSFDNLKRVAMRVCRDLLVFPLGKSLDNGWLLAAESAADEYAAVRGGSGYALNLASALVKIGRITPQEQTHRLPIAAYLIEPDDTSLADRVDGLLKLADAGERTSVSGSRFLAAAKYLIPATLIICFITLATNSAFLMAIHSLSESVLSSLE